MFAQDLNGELLPNVDGMRVNILGYHIIDQRTVKRFSRRVSFNFSMQSTYSYEKMPFRIKSLKSSIANFENSDRVIFNVSILRNDTIYRG